MTTVQPEPPCGDRAGRSLVGVRGVLLDIDHTLVDTEAAFVAALGASIVPLLDDRGGAERGALRDGLDGALRDGPDGASRDAGARCAPPTVGDLTAGRCALALPPAASTG